MTIPEYDQCDCGIRGPHARCREKAPVEKEFGEFMQSALSANQNKYPACQECSRSDAGECDACVKIEKWPPPSGRIMGAIRQEVQDSLAAAKLAGYRQAQREEFDFWKENNYFAGSKITERIMHLRKELGL